ncbi:MAG: PepSY-like domain-containing protein [Chitinophagaceae bacterium]
MKIFLPIVAAAIAASFISCGQKSDESKTPEAVKDAFSKNFPGVTPGWEKENGNYEAEFKKEGHEMSAVFESDGTMTESEMEIETTELPSAALDYIKANYAGETIKEAAKITKVNGEINYEAEVKGTDLIFDANGTFLKQDKE